jgi:hypothetical protein
VGKLKRFFNETIYAFWETNILPLPMFPRQVRKGKHSRKYQNVEM